MQARKTHALHNVAARALCAVLVAGAVSGCDCTKRASKVQERSARGRSAHLVRGGRRRRRRRVRLHEEGQDDHQEGQPRLHGQVRVDAVRVRVADDETG
jgi:hypothetical protein